MCILPPGRYFEYILPDVRVCDEKMIGICGYSRLYFVQIGLQIFFIYKIIIYVLPTRLSIVRIQINIDLELQETRGETGYQRDARVSVASLLATSASNTR